MRRAVFALALCSSLLAADTCPDPNPGNARPTAPAIAVTLLGTTTISGTVSPCQDDGLPNPPATCTQLAVASLPGSANAISQVTVTAGTWTLIGLNPATDYELLAMSDDSDKRAYSPLPLLRVRTAATTGPQVLGVAPTEIVTPSSDVYVSGRDFTSHAPISATLVDSTTGQVRSVAVEGVDQNRVRVRIETPSDLNGRRRYFLRINANNKADTHADVVYLSSSSIYRPPRQLIRVQLVHWTWLINCFPVPPFEPCTCGYGQNFTYRTDQYDPWPDQWANTFWSRFASHLNDTSREWSAMCSAAWESDTWTGGVSEVMARITLPGIAEYHPRITTDSVDIAQLATRTYYQSGTPVADRCDTYISAFLQTTMPADCTHWQPNGDGRINVHLVGKLRDGSGEEIDPGVGARGIADPANIYTTNTRGMVILTDNPYLGARPTLIDAGMHCLGDFVDANNPNSPMNTTYWWGPGRSTESTPNLLSHELLHTTTLYAHGGLSDPCFTPSVGFPTAQCPRGLKMDLGANSTVASECAKVQNGINGRDYTQ